MERQRAESEGQCLGSRVPRLGLIVAKVFFIFHSENYPGNGLHVALHDGFVPRSKASDGAIVLTHYSKLTTFPVLSNIKLSNYSSRFRIRHKETFQFKDYTPDMTVTGLWHSTMAGGVANIWGNLLPHNDNDRGSQPYDNGAGTTIRGTKVEVNVKDEIKTWSTFWFEKDRFSYDYIRDNRLTGNKTGPGMLSDNGEPISVCLLDSSYSRYIFYSEETNKVTMDLRQSDKSLKAVAIDTRKAYKEIPIGKIDAEKFAWEAPYTSDWAVAVGKFDE